MAIFGAGIDSFISAANGNMLTAGTWGKIDPTMQNDEVGQSGNTFLDGTKVVSISTAYVVSATGTQTATPSNVDGIAIKIATVNAAPSGTISVALDIGGVDVTGSVVTCNISDLKPFGWHFFKFSSPITLIASTAYAIKVKTSVTSQITLCASSNNTATTIHRLLRTTTTGVPQNGASQNDNMYVMGEITGPAAVTTRTVTWDNTSDTNPFNMLTIGCYGTVTAQTTASTNYSLRVQNDLRIFHTGILNIGSFGTAFPSTSTFTLTFHNTAQPASAGGFGLSVFKGGTLNSYGATKTCLTTLTANVAATGTSVTVASATNWAVGDLLAFASTTTTASQVESRAISSISGTTIGVAALTNAHLGTSPKIGEVINLTRNIVIKGRSTTQQAWVSGLDGSFINAYYTEFTLIGSSNGVLKGVNLNATTSGLKFDIQFCSFHDSANFASGIFIPGTNIAATITISNNVSYNIAQSHILVAATSTTLALTVTFNTCMLNTDSSTSIIDWSCCGGTLSSNRVSSNISIVNIGGGIVFRQGFQGSPTVDSNIIHSCTGPGVLWVNSGTLFTIGSSNWTTWCCDMGLHVAGRMTISTFTVDTWTSYSNVTTHLNFRFDFVGTLQFSSLNLQAGTTPACPVGIRVNDGSQGNTVISFSVANSTIGDVTAHSTADIYITSPQICNIALQNTKLGTGSVVGQAQQRYSSSISSDRHNQIDNNYKIWLPYGTVTRDDVIFGTSDPSIRVTPTDGTNKVSVGQFYASVPGGSSVTVSLKVRRSVSGDGAAHNGNFPRLRLAPNPAAGINAYSTLATATSASNGAFETLSGTIGPVTGDSIVNFFVDVDGTTGWINIDDISSDLAGVDTGGMSYAINGQPFVNLGTGGSITTTRYIPMPRRKVV